MADKRKSYEERMKEATEEKARKEAELEDNNLIKEVMNSDMNDDVKVEIIKRLAQKQEPIYVPYVQSPANWWESKPTYVSAPTTSDPIENQPHTVCSNCQTSISVPNKICPRCDGRGVVHIGNRISGGGTEDS